MSRHRRPPGRAALTVLGALTIAACGGAVGADDSAQPARADDDGTSASEAAAFTQVFETATVIDQPFDGATLAGNDAVLWFWAPWCTVCRAEAPDVNAVAERYGDQVTFVGVGGRGAIGEMEGFIDDTATGGLHHVADLDGSIWQAFGVYAQPAFAFIDESGDIEVFVGGLGEDALAERLDRLLA